MFLTRILTAAQKSFIREGEILERGAEAGAGPGNIANIEWTPPSTGPQLLTGSRIN